MKTVILLLAILILATGAVNAAATLTVKDMRCEYLQNPMGIDTPHPRLSWKLQSDQSGQVQAAYRILVATSPAKLARDIGDLWDSGKVKSDRSIHIVYAGHKLKSRQRVFWKVRVWDKEDGASAWSEPAFWEMGLEPSDWQAKWTGNALREGPEISSTNPAPYFRKSFSLSEQAKKARVYISGLGYYELYINGKKVGDHVLSPNHTNYDRRQSTVLDDDRVGNMSTRVLYETYDITPYLQAGENVIGVILGNGWYFQNERQEDIPLSYDTPRFIAQVEVELPNASSRKTIISDNTWKTAYGPIVHNGIYSGEIYDARLEQPGWNDVGFDDSDWEQARLVRAPEGKLMAQMSPPDRVIMTLKPVSLSHPEPGLWRYDLGQVISGWARIKVKGPRGAKIKMKFIEDFGFTYGQTDTYILKGDGEEIWEPRFTWHAFRYVDVLDPPFAMTIDNLEGRVVNTDVDTAGVFECSNDLFNRILQNYKWTQLGNMHGGIPSDCPHRERRGYTGDGQIAAQAAIYNFDMAAFYSKWLNDIKDAQNARTGYVPNTVPYQNGGGGAAWGSAYIIIPWYMYLYYGDQQVLEQHYKGMKKWIGYLEQQLGEDGIIRERMLGEWVPPEPTEIPPNFVSTAYFYHDLKLMQKIAAVVGRSDDARAFARLAAQTQKAFHKKYFHPDKMSYSIGRQGANVFALGFGLVPDSLQAGVFASLVNNIEKRTRGHFDTGMMGTPLLLDVLTRFGRVDLAYTVMNQRDYPGFGYEIAQGATTIWETWPGTDSHSHPMFGSVCQWFYQALAGINPDPVQSGFKHIIIRPQPVATLNFVSATYRSVYGDVRTQWQMRDSDFVLHVTVPPNSDASVFVPALSEDNVTVDRGEATFVEMNNHVARYRIGSGNYTFISRNAGSLFRMPMLITPTIEPKDTIAFMGDTILVRIASGMDGTEIRYTLDGSEPSENSLLYEKPIRIDKSCIVKARLFKNGVQPSYVQTSTFTFIDPARNGLIVQYFKGQWDRLPDFSTLKPTKSQKVYSVSLDEIVTTSDAFALVFKGKLKIERTGDYTFYINSNDGSRLFIDNVLVVDNDGLHGAVEKSGRIRLGKGVHSIKITYFQAGGGMLLQGFMSGPDMKKQEISPSILFSQ